MRYNLVGVDGNAHAVMAYVAHAMRQEGFSRDMVSEYYHDAMSGDYNHLLCVSMEWLDECNKRHEEQ